MILGEKETVLYGKGYIEDEALRKDFPYFFQILLSGQSGPDRETCMEKQSNWQDLQAKSV